jgi:hypothetical protein
MIPRHKEVSRIQEKIAPFPPSIFFQSLLVALFLVSSEENSVKGTCEKILRGYPFFLFFLPPKGKTEFHVRELHFLRILQESMQRLHLHHTSSARKQKGREERGMKT